MSFSFRDSMDILFRPFLVAALLIVFCSLAPHAKVDAIVHNPTGIPAGLQIFDVNTPAKQIERRCQPGGIGNVFPGTLMQWISRLGHSTDVNVMAIPGQDHVDLQWNVAGAHCTINMKTLPHHVPVGLTTWPLLGNVYIDTRVGRATYMNPTDSWVSGQPPGSNLTINAPSNIALNYEAHSLATPAHDGNNSNDRIYTKSGWDVNAPPYSSPLRLNGLNNLPAGTYTLTVAILTRPVNQWHLPNPWMPDPNGPGYNASLTCVNEPRQAAHTTIGVWPGGACNQGPTFLSFNLTIPESKVMVTRYDADTTTPGTTGAPTPLGTQPASSGVPYNADICLTHVGFVLNLQCNGSTWGNASNPTWPHFVVAANSNMYQAGIQPPPGWQVEYVRVRRHNQTTYSDPCNGGQCGNSVMIGQTNGVGQDPLYVDVYYKELEVPVCDGLEITGLGTLGFPEPNQLFNVKLKFNYGQNTPYNFTVVVNAPGIPGLSGTHSGTGPPGEIVFNNLSVSTPGRYPVTWVVNIDGQPPLNCQGQITVGERPYVRAYGNDVHAGGVIVSPDGGGIGDINECTLGQVSNPGASIYALTLEQNFNAPPPNNFYGAGSQFGVSTLGEIGNFFSASLHNPRRTNFAASPVHGITFGNYNGTSGSHSWNPDIVDADKVPNFGGSSSIVRCVPDYYAAAPEPVTPVAVLDISNMGADEARHVRPVGNRVILNGSNITGKKAVYVDGDVVINSNITFANFSGSNTIPSLYIIAKGNIYISPTVTRIDGVYIAQKNDGNAGGVIHTCANIGSNNITVPRPEIGARCANQLVINGAFLADTIKFLRSRGTLQIAQNSGLVKEPASSGNIAEVFNFSPETYIGDANPTLRRGAGSYDFITSLPPIL